jgi:nucleoside-diphosphate-sugar epimerase
LVAPSLEVLIMRVFVTGASGFIGSAVVPELISSGHAVIGLARSDASAAAIAAAGAEVLRGDLGDLDSLRSGAASSDGVIHLAYVHDFTRYDESVRIDLQAIEAMGTALEGTDRPFLVASGVLGLAASGGAATENDPHAPGVARATAAQRTVELAQRGVRSSVVRLAPTVHGDGDHGFMATLINIARDKGVSGYIGDGSNRWPAVHRDDAAHLFRLALDKAPAGSILHATAEDGVPVRAIAEVIGRHLDVPVVSIDADQAADHFAWLGAFLGFDAPASSALTRELLDWQPTHPGLIDDLDKGHYFD